MLIRLLCCTLMICCLPGCYVFDANLPRPKAEYCQRSEQTIVVTAGMGFRRPGVHHVPRGTTLRQFLKIAQILPERDWTPGHFSICACKVGMIRNGKGAGFMTALEPSEKEYETILEDGAKVAVLRQNL